MSVRVVLLPAIAWMLMGVAPVQFAIAAKEETPPPIRFLRVFAPEDRISEWPLGEEKYLPVEAAEFERLAASAQLHASKVPGAPSAVIDSARYEAKFADDQLVGEAAMSMTLAGSAPAAVAFEPCNLALGASTWSAAGGEESKTGQRAALGLTSGGKQELMVEQSGRLSFGWSLDGRRDPGDIVSFSFEIPVASASRLFLELPERLTPMVDRGMIVGSEAAGEHARRWQIELGGNRRFHLRVVAAGAIGRRAQLALLSESRTYDVTPRGLEVSAQWKLQVHNEPLQQITVLLDPELQLASARCGDATIPWSAEPSADGESTRVVLRLPEPIGEVERVVRLRALGRTVLDRPWRAPRIRSEGLFWQEGEITLLMPEPLVAERMAPYGCEQTSTGPLSAPRTGESAQFQCFGPDATVELFVSHRSASVHISGAAAIRIGGEEATARVAVDLQSAEGARFAIDADVAKRWMVDAVESVPAGAVADWTLDPRPDGGQLLAIRLAEALLPGRPLRLTITAHRVFSPGLQSLEIDDLWPLGFHNIAGSKRLVSVRCEGAYALRFAGAEHLALVAADSLTPAELDLFAQPPGDLLFEYDPQMTGLRVSMVGRAAKYAGTIRVEAAVGDRVLHESYRLRCAAEAGQVNRVLVQFRPRSDAAVHWTLGDEEDRQMSARRWSIEEQRAAGRDVSSETWELTFGSPRSVPFEITAAREIPLVAGREEPIALAALPEAANQRGTVVISDLGPRAVHIENRRLRPMFPESTSADRSQAVRGVYRYDPAQDLVEGTGVAVRVLDASEPGAPQAWAWNCSLQSWYQSDGTARHTATYEMQNYGRDSFQLVLPHVAGSDLHGVWLDGKPVEARVAAADGGTRVSVDLPAGRKFPCVTIQWAAAEARLGVAGSRAVPVLNADLPVFGCRWMAWLPPGYESVGSCGDSAPACGAGLTWSRRLFGPLGRSAGQPRFNPLSADDWLTPLAGHNGQKQTAEPIGIAEHGRKQESAGPKLPWASGNATGGQSTDVQGEPAWCVEVSPNTPIAMAFVQCASMRLFGAVAFLLTVALGCWRAAGRITVLVGWLGGFCVVALLLPNAYAPIGSGGVLGVMFCLALQWIGRPTTRAENGSSSTHSAVSSGPGSKVTAAVQRSVGLLIVLGALLHGGVLRADSAAGEPEKPAADSSPLYRVFVPIDGQQKVTGGKVYVPEVLYRELNRRASASAEKPRGWLIVAATYRGKLSAETTTGRLSVDTLRAQYDLRVFGRGTRVRIPLRPEGANLLPNSALLDGRVIEPEWEPDGATLAFDVAEPGEYRLELALRPIMRSSDGPEGFDVMIPRVAASRLELELPEGAPAVDVPSACGTTELEKDPPRLSANLGPADRLAVRWQEGVASSSNGPAVDVEQLMWLKVQPGSVVMSAKFKLHVVEGQVQQVQLAADPRLRLLPLPGEDPPTVQVGPETAQSRLITFRWPHPISDQVTLDATFLLSGTLGVGNFRLPLMELLDVRPTQRWLAVTVDPALDREEEQKQQLETATVSDFLRAWGEPGPKPQTAYRLPAGEIDWTLSTRPHEPRTTVDQVLTLKFDEEHVDVDFEAELSTASGTLFQHRVTMPEGSKIESVSLMEEGVERAARWSQDAGGGVTVFLSGPVSGRQKLAVRGQVPMRAGVEWMVPAVQVEKCEIHSALFRLLRYPSVRLAVRGGRQGAGEDAAGGDAAAGDRCRFVEAFSWDGAQPLLVAVATERNQPVVRAQQTVRPEWNGRSWSIRTDCRITVRGGVLDEIRIRAPAGWNGPYQTSPAGELRTSETPGEDRQVIYWPQTAVTDSIELSIESPLEVGRGERPTVPDIGLMQVAELERWFLLPGESQGREIHWQTRGLTPSTRPKMAAASSGMASDARWAAYRVTGEAAQAVLAAAETAGGSAGVQLADIVLVWHVDGSCYGTAAFDLEPGGVASCPLRLPKGCQLVQVLVEGMPVTPESAGQGDWYFALASQRLPQRVRLLFRGELTGGNGGGRCTFAAPALGDLPVRQTIWTVYGSPLMKPSSVQYGTIASWQGDLIRLESSAAAIEAANSVSAEDGSEESPQWFQSWSRRLMVSGDALRRDLAGVGPSVETGAAKQKADRIEQQNVDLAQRLGATEVLAQRSAVGSTASNPGEILANSIGATGSTVRCRFGGRADTLAVDYRSTEGDWLAYRLAGAAGLALLFALGAIGSVRKRLVALLGRWPHVAVAALGLGWWLWLWPSIVGLGIVLASILAAGYSALAFDSKSSQKSRA